MPPKTAQPTATIPGASKKETPPSGAAMQMLQMTPPAANDNNSINPQDSGDTANVSNVSNAGSVPSSVVADLQDVSNNSIATSNDHDDSRPPKRQCLDGEDGPTVNGNGNGNGNSGPPDLSGVGDITGKYDRQFITPDAMAFLTATSPDAGAEGEEEERSPSDIYIMDTIKKMTKDIFLNGLLLRNDNGQSVYIDIWNHLMSHFDTAELYKCCKFYNESKVMNACVSLVSKVAAPARDSDKKEMIEFIANKCCIRPLLIIRESRYSVPSAAFTYVRGECPTFVNVAIAIIVFSALYAGKTAYTKLSNKGDANTNTNTNTNANTTVASNQPFPTTFNGNPF